MAKDCPHCGRGPFKHLQRHISVMPVCEMAAIERHCAGLVDPRWTPEKLAELDPLWAADREARPQYGHGAGLLAAVRRQA